MSSTYAPTPAYVAADDHETCAYFVQWSPRGDKSVVRNYRRTAPMHDMQWVPSYGHHYLRCTRCGVNADVQS